MGLRPHNNQRGHSLLEAMVSLSVFLLVLFAVYLVLMSNQTIYAKGEGMVDAQRSARAFMDSVPALLRNAGYFAENFDANPGNDVIDPPIQIATDNALAIYGDANGTGTSNVFLFCQNGTLVRWITSAPPFTPTAYTCDQGMILARNATNLTFTYFDANNNPIPTPPTPPYQLDAQETGLVPSFLDTTQRGAIRRVVITLTATEAVAGQRPQIYSLTSDVRLRNTN